MQEPDFEMWINDHRLWTLYEAACLLSGVKPLPHDNKKLIPAALMCGQPKRMYANLKSAAIKLNEIWCEQQLPDDPFFMYRVKPRECLVWALSNKYDLPPALEVEARHLSEIRQQEENQVPGIEAIQPLSRQRAQEQALLKMLSEKGYDATNLPKPENGKAGVKKEIRMAAKECRNDLFSGTTTFDKAWERLSATGEIQYKN